MITASAALPAKSDFEHIRKQSMGNSPLHLVSQARQDDPDQAASIATIELLLDCGADPMGRNNEGKTPQQWARGLGMDEVADYMAERFARSDTGPL